MFALMLPMIFALGGVVIGIGNWYVHAQAPADESRRRRVRRR